MELEIIQWMKQSAGTSFSYKEVGRMVARSEFRKDPHWARPILEKLVFDQQIWRDGVRYLCPTEQQKAELKQSKRLNTYKAPH